MGVGTVRKAVSQKRCQIQQGRVEDSSDAALCVFQLGEGKEERVTPNMQEPKEVLLGFQPTSPYTRHRHLAQNFHLGSAERRGR